MKQNKSLFITFEGGDGAGKTTLIDGIYLQLKSKGLDVLQTREPGGTPLGEKVRSLLLEPSSGDIAPFAELCLFLTSRAQQLYEVIKPALSEKKIVLCDRYNDSSIAYQGFARSLGVQKVSKICNLICEDLHPDLSFYLDIEPKLGLKRGSSKKDRIESEALSFHEKIRSAYLNLAKKNPKRLHVLDATKEPKDVLFDAMKFIRKILVD